MNFKKFVRSVLAFPNSIYNWFILKYRRVSIGKNLIIRGRIFCIANQKNAITIGKNVTINSSRGANPIGGETKTILFAKNDGKIVIGNNCGISNATLFATECIEVEDNVLIGGGVKIYDTDFHHLDYSKRINDVQSVSKPVRIKEGAFIGAHSIILKGVTVGKHSIVGAGSVVSKDIPDNEIWAGNPARFIRKV